MLNTSHSFFIGEKEYAYRQDPNVPRQGKDDHNNQQTLSAITETQISQDDERESPGNYTTDSGVERLGMDFGRTTLNTSQNVQSGPVLNYYSAQQSSSNPSNYISSSNPTSTDLNQSKKGIT